MTRRVRRAKDRPGPTAWWMALLILGLIAYLGSQRPDILAELVGESGSPEPATMRKPDPAADRDAAPASDGAAVPAADSPDGRPADSNAERPAARAGEASEEERALVAAVNVARRERGLSALAWHSSLATAAQAHSLDMAAAGLCRHEGSDGSDVGDRLRRQGYPAASFAENIACGTETPAETVSLWLGSKAHRDNLLGRQYTDLGVGVADGSERVWSLVLGDR